MIGESIKIFEELESTNSFVKHNLSNLEDGTVIVAKRQIKGRGRRDNVWKSELGNLYFSFILKDRVFRSDIFKYIVRTSLAITHVMEEYGIRADIKYPNDCLVDRKKISGILIETSGSSSLDCIIVGVGINVNQSDFKELGDKATSMKLITKKEYEIKEVLNAFIGKYKEIMKDDYEDVFTHYIQKSIVIHKYIKYKNETYRINSIEQNGTIIIKNESSEERVAFSEISLKDLYDNA